MSGPRTKRPFAGAASDPTQRQITSYFTKSTSPSNAPSPPPGPLNGPVLPTAVQSNLLTVGMRVRKSVVEGYKTSASESAFSLWSDSTPFPPRSASSSGAVDATRELAPFCGIHKVGGLAVQPVSALTPTPFSTSPPSSQDSVSSSTSATEVIERSRASTGMDNTNNTNTRKRFFIAIDDDSTDDNPTDAIPIHHGGPWRRREEWIDEEISPRSFAPAGWGNARIMAVPRTRKSHTGPRDSAEMDQENMAADRDEADFDEATFLDMELE